MPETPYEPLEKAVINRVIALGERTKWGADEAGSIGSSGEAGSSAAAGPERWVQFGALCSSRVAVEQPAAAAGAASAARPASGGRSGGGRGGGPEAGPNGRLLRDYLALPVDQYSLLDPKWISREEGGQFRFSLPLQDLVNVDLQPEILISVSPEPQRSRVTLMGTRAALGSPEIDEAFKLNVSTVISQRQRRRLPPLPRPPDHLPGRPVFRLRRWAAAARGRKWPPEEAGSGGEATAPGAPAAGASVPLPAGNTATSDGANGNGSSSSDGQAAEPKPLGGEAAAAAAAAAAAGVAPIPGQHVYISHDSRDDDEYWDVEAAAAALPRLADADVALAELDGDAPPPPAPAAADVAAVAEAVGLNDSSSNSSSGGESAERQPGGGGDGGASALLHCRTHVTMALRVPRALRVVPNALLGYAGSLLLRAVLTATLPNFLDLLAADYRRWAGDSGPDGDGGGVGRLTAPAGELFADAAATVREGRARRRCEPEAGAAVRQ